MWGNFKFDIEVVENRTVICAGFEEKVRSVSWRRSTLIVEQSLFYWDWYKKVFKEDCVHVNVDRDS